MLPLTQLTIKRKSRVLSHANFHPTFSMFTHLGAQRSLRIAINSIDRTTRFRDEEARFERFHVDPSVLSSLRLVHSGKLELLLLLLLLPSMLTHRGSRVSSTVILACLLAPRAFPASRSFRKDVARRRTAHDFLEWNNSEIGQIGLPVERRNDRTDYIIV